jgi:hypothetical protein
VLSAAGRAVLAEGLPDVPAGDGWGPVPEYGSLAWCRLPAGDARRLVSMRRAADCWALLMGSPHVAELLAEFAQWSRRRADKAAAVAVSAAGDWLRAARVPTYAEVARRRAELGCPVRCPVCGRVRTCWPVPAVLECERCAPGGDGGQ